MKFVVVIVLVIISTIINIFAYFIQKREVAGIKYNFRQIRNMCKSLKDREN